MEKVVSPTKVALTWGIITSLVAFIFSLIFYVTDLWLKPGVSWIGLVWLIGGMYLCMKQRRDKDLGGYMTYGQGFNVGFLMSVFMAMIGIFTTFLMMKVIAPDMIDQIINHTRDGMMQKGMSDEMIEKAMSVAAPFMSPTAIVIEGMIFNIIGGLIVALLVALVVKKEPKLLQPPQ